MNITKKNFYRGFSYTVFANLFSVVISTALILIIPRYLGLHEYGLWQLYIFYSSYISYLSLGITDGAYLRYGGQEYKNLKKPVFVSQFWLLVLFDVVATGFIFGLAYFFIEDVDRQFIIGLVCVSGILTVPRSLLTFMMQATNRIQQNALTIIVERSIYFIIVIGLLLSGSQSYLLMISADLIGKLFSIVYAIIQMKEMVIGKFASFTHTFKEVFINMNVGVKLLIANLSSLLIIGIVRFGIEQKWGVTTFAQVSLTLSISNMIMIFINSIGLILFPILKRVKENDLREIYINLREILTFVLLILLLSYYPINLFLSVWLPEYQDSLKYMILLFPMIIFESKIVLLTNTYLKTMRQEVSMLVINMSVVALSGIFTVFFVMILESITLAVLSITILLFIKANVSEHHLSKLLGINFKKLSFIELIITFIFIIATWYFNLVISSVVCLIMLSFYFIFRRYNILKAVNYLRKF